MPGSRIINIAASLIALLVLPAAGFGKDACSVKNIGLVKNMPPARSQDGVNFCYAFSAVAQVQHIYCKNKPGGCKYSFFEPQEFDDRLSVIDAISLAKNGSLVEFGRIRSTLEAIKANGALAKENCAPFDGFLQESSALKGEKATVWQKLRGLYEKYRNSATKPPSQKIIIACTIAKEAKETANLKTDIQEIAAALERQQFETFVKEVSLPKKCEYSRVSIPPFSVKTSESADPRVTAPIIAHKLIQGTPVGASICTNMNDKKNCGGHFVVLSGIRERCCGKICKKQYRLYDSANVFWSNSERDDYFEPWVDSTIVLEKIRQFGVHKEAGGPVQWLE